MNSDNYKKIKINDFPPTKIYVLLNKYMREKIIESSKLTLNTPKNYDLALWLNKQSSKYGLNTKFNGGDVANFKEGKKLDIRTGKVHLRTMPVWIILELANLSKIPLDEIHENILHYRSSGSGDLISNPKLPIKITPEFESIIFHLFGDGSAGDGTPSFAQKNLQANKQFSSKLKNCFGEFNTKEQYNKNSEVRCIRFPKAITCILSYFYKIESYNSNKIRIPLKIYKSEKINKLACIIAIILDEGNIRDIINISSKSKDFLKDLKRSIESCGYKCQKIKPHKGSNTFYLNLSNNSIENFYQDYMKLVNKFPTCSLAHKNNDLKYIISRRKNKSNIKDIDKAILSVLKTSKLTTKQISQKLGFANCTTLHHLCKLYKKRKIKRNNKGRGFAWYS